MTMARAAQWVHATKKGEEQENTGARAAAATDTRHASCVTHSLGWLWSLCPGVLLLIAALRRPPANTAAAARGRKHAGRENSLLVGEDASHDGGAIVAAQAHQHHAAGVREARQASREASEPLAEDMPPPAEQQHGAPELPPPEVVGKQRCMPGGMRAWRFEARRCRSLRRRLVHTLVTRFRRMMLAATTHPSLGTRRSTRNWYWVLVGETTQAPLSVRVSCVESY